MPSRINTPETKLTGYALLRWDLSEVAFLSNFAKGSLMEPLIVIGRGKLAMRSGVSYASWTNDAS